MKIPVQVTISTSIHAATTENGNPELVVCKRDVPRLLWLDRGDAEALRQVHGKSAVKFASAEPTPVEAVPAEPARKGRRASKVEPDEATDGPAKILAEGDSIESNHRLVDETGKPVDLDIEGG